MDEEIPFDHDPLVERDDTPQSVFGNVVPEESVVITPITDSRKHWGSFFAELDRAKCGTHLEKDIFHYCAKRPDTPISFREIVLALGGIHPGLDTIRVMNVAGKLAQKFRDGKPGFAAQYHETHQTLMYVTVERKPKLRDVDKGKAEVEAIFKKNPELRAMRAADAREEAAYFAELLGDVEDEIAELLKEK